MSKFHTPIRLIWSLSVPCKTIHLFFSGIFGETSEISMKTREIWMSNNPFLWERCLLRSGGSVKLLLYRSAAPGFTFSRQNLLVVTSAAEGRVSGSASSAEKSVILKREKESKGCSVSRDLCSAGEGLMFSKLSHNNQKRSCPSRNQGLLLLLRFCLSSPTPLWE